MKFRVAEIVFFLLFFLLENSTMIKLQQPQMKVLLQTPNLPVTNILNFRSAETQKIALRKSQFQNIMTAYQNNMIASLDLQLETQFANLLNQNKLVLPNKIESPDERNYRFSVFRANIEEINQQNQNPLCTFKRLQNQFAALTKDQFKELYLSQLKVPTKRKTPIQLISQSRSLRFLKQIPTITFSFPLKTFSLENVVRINNKILKETFLNPSKDKKVNEGLIKNIDWRDLAKMLPIKNQGSCNSCWIFAAVDAIQTMWAYKKRVKNMVPLSVQYFIDCMNLDPSYLSLPYDTCVPGSVLSVYAFLMNKLVASEASYPFIGKRGLCQTEKNFFIKPQNFYTNIRYVDPKNPFEMSQQSTQLKILLKKSVVSVIVNAIEWQFYHEGIISCNQKQELQMTNHAVNLVGANYDDNYWIIRNSWGISWGQVGYGYVDMDKNHDCGITSLGISPLIL